MHHAHIHRFPKMLNDEGASAASRWNYPSGLADYPNGLAVRRNGLGARRSALAIYSSGLIGGELGRLALA